MKKAVITLLIFSLIFITGCWDHKELNELAIILAAGIDRTPDGKIELTLQLARPPAFGGGATAEGGGGGATTMGQNIVWVVSATGETIFDAMRNLALQVPRHLCWTHCILIVFGGEVCRHGVRDVTNFIHRYPGPRETMWVMVTPGKAKKVLKSHCELEKTSAQSLGFLARTKAGLSIEFKDFIHDLAIYGINPVAARVELKRQGEPQGPGMEKVHKHKQVIMTGTAVFKDEKLVGWLDKKETQGLLWLRGKMKKGIILIPEKKDRGKKISFEIIRSYTRIYPEYDGEKIRFYVKILAEGNLIEQQSKEDLAAVEAIKSVEEAVAGKIETRVKNALDKAQGEYGVDIFGFGEAFHRKYKKEWKKIERRWNEEFNEAEIYLNVDARIKNTGLQAKRASIKG